MSEAEDTGRRAHRTAVAGRASPRELSGDRAELLDELERHHEELGRRERELQRTAAELERTTQRYRAVYDDAPLGHLTVGPEGWIHEANRVAAALLGMPATALCGARLDTFVDSSDREELHEALRRALRRALDADVASKACELRLHRGARASHVSADCVALPSSDRDGPRVLVTLVDRTEQERNRAKMARREARLGAVVAHAGDVLLVLDEAGRLTAFDAAAERLFGRTAWEVLGRPAAELFEELPSAVAEGHALRWDGRIRRADGSTLEVEVAVGPVPEIGEVVLIVRDVTERRRLERELRHAQKVEAMGRLSAGIAHDMNNVLMAIVGAADRAARRTDDPEQLRERLDEIRCVAEGGAAVVRRLTSFAREGRGAGAVELDAVVRDVVVMLRPLLGEDIDLAVVLDAAGAYARCDAGRLEQVVVNLAVNARDAMPVGGRLEVITGRGGDGAVRLVVRDSGTGMEPAVARSVFEPFFTTKEDGSGLGLSVVKSIVEECEGSVEVQSEPGWGTTFSVELPEATGVTRRFEEVGSIDALPPQTVLLVEGDALVRRAARSFLERSGHGVLEAANAFEALAQCRQSAVDVMLTDVILQKEVSGPELAERVRAERPETRVLLMSGYSHHELIKRGRVSDETFVLQKPFSERELHAALACMVFPAFEPERQLAATEGDGAEQVEPVQTEGDAPPVVVVVEKRAHAREALAELLREAGYEVRGVAGLGGARDPNGQSDGSIDAIVLGTDGPDGEDLELVRGLLAERPGLGIVLLGPRDLGTGDLGTGDLGERDGPRAQPNFRFLRKPAGTGELVEAIEAVRSCDSSSRA